MDLILEWAPFVMVSVGIGCLAICIAISKSIKNAAFYELEENSKERAELLRKYLLFAVIPGARNGEETVTIEYLQSRKRNVIEIPRRFLPNLKACLESPECNSSESTPLSLEGTSCGR
jgi:hypothetical protein